MPWLGSNDVHNKLSQIKYLKIEIYCPYFWKLEYPDQVVCWSMLFQMAPGDNSSLFLLPNKREIENNQLKIYIIKN